MTKSFKTALVCHSLLNPVIYELNKNLDTHVILSVDMHVNAMEIFASYFTLPEQRTFPRQYTSLEEKMEKRSKDLGQLVEDSERQSRSKANRITPISHV